MDKKDNLAEDTFFQFCLQSLTPLVSCNMFSGDLEKIKSEGCRCKCSKSQCLKLYCECFLQGKYCLGCNCINCLNTPDYENLRQKAITQITYKRNRDSALNPKKFQGCICSKTKCLKKYCKCFIKGKKCSDLCRCEGCENLSHS
jgi:hypothetical protein